jgi:hypothetical protein
MAENLNYKNQPTPPTAASPSANASASRLVTYALKATTHTTDHDAVEEEDPQDQPKVALDSDEEDRNGDGHGPDEHLLSEAEATLRRLVGATVEKTAAGEETVVWTIVPALTIGTRKERSTYFREKGVGLKGGIPTSNDGDVDKLSLWLHLYPLKIEDDLRRLNEEGFRKKAGWKHVTQ